MDNLSLLTENTGQNSSTRLLTEPKLAPSYLNLRSDLSLTTSNVVAVLNKDILKKYTIHHPPEARATVRSGSPVAFNQNEPYLFEFINKNWCRADQIKVSVKVRVNLEVTIKDNLPIVASESYANTGLNRMDITSFAQPAYVFGEGIKARVYVSGTQVSPEEFMTDSNVRTAYLQSLPMSDVHKRTLAPLGLPYQAHYPNTLPTLKNPQPVYFTNYYSADSVAEEAYRSFWGKFYPQRLNDTDNNFFADALIQIPLWFFSPFFFDKVLIPPNTAIQVQMYTQNDSFAMFNNENIIIQNNIERVVIKSHQPYLMSYQQLIFNEATKNEITRLVSTKPLIYQGLFFRCYHTTRTDTNEAPDAIDYRFQVQGGPMPSQIWIVGQRGTDLTYNHPFAEIDLFGPSNFKLYNERVEINNHILVNNEFTTRFDVEGANFVNISGRDFYECNSGSTVGTIPSIKLVPNAPFQATEFEAIDMRIKGDYGYDYSKPVRQEPNATTKVWGCTPIYWSMSLQGVLKQEYTASNYHFGSVYFK